MPTPLTAGAPVDPAPSQHEHRRTNGPPLNLSRVVESSQPAFISSLNRSKRSRNREGEMSPEEEASASPPAALIAGRDDERRVSSPPQGSKFLLDDVPCTRVQRPITKVSDEEGSSDEEVTRVPSVNDVAKKRENPENEDSCGTSDVENFEGKIVYNPDGSAYIIDDSELSEEDTIAELPKLIGDGCIIDGRGINTSQPQSFPQIANAFYVSRNPSLYNALYGSSAALASRILQDKKKVPEVPVMHSYRVYTVRDKSCDGDGKRENEENEEDKSKQYSSKDCSSVPVKPILMCFICKLSFGYAKSFVAHAMGDHNVVLREDEKDILGQKNASAIIQCVGKEKEPLVSFLEPLSTTIPEDKPALSAVSLILKPPHKLFGSEPVRNSRPPSGNGNQGSSECAGVTVADSLLARRPLQSPVVQNHVPEISVSLPQHGSSSSSVNHSNKTMNSSVMDLTRKSPVSAGNTGRSSASPGAGTSPSSALSPLMATTPSSSLPYPPPPPNFLTGTTIGVCPDHMGGRPSGVECAKCELILSSSRLGGVGGPLAGMHSRNSCKTLKCPKCNWHYKYQETLEIHMKEKHPESETSCIYCIAGQPHPRLARGETYTCGYKPYRCEVCNYSTTTKGNLSIHMQSDKHLNNMQELQNGGVPTSESSPSVMQHSPHQTPPQHHKPSGMPSPSTPHHHLAPVNSNIQNQKPKPTFRCDVCNYETNVARNLRIHMTSEKHTHNMMVLQQNVKHMQTLSVLQQHQSQQQQQQQLNFESLLHFHPGLTLPGEKPPPHTEAALADMAYNQALLIQMMTGGQLPPHIPPELAPHMDMGLNPETMEPPPEPADPNPSHLYTCCVCNNFHTDSLEALSHHLSADRTKIREQEILTVVAGHYVCKLCTYKTNLKANFQLHCKTDKHLQRLQHVNHVKEGGPRNEWKLKYVSSPGGIQVRCHPCDYYTNSAHKLQLHTAGQRHEAGCLLFRHLREAKDRFRDSEDKIYHCVLCGFSSRAKLQLFQHVRSMKHLQMEQLHQLQRRTEGKEHQTDIGDIFQVTQAPEGYGPDSESERKESQSSNRESSRQEAQEEELNISTENQSHGCPYCNYTSNSELRIQAHIVAQHSQSEGNQQQQSGSSSASASPQSKDFLCPLCSDGFRDRTSLEKHVMQIHSVNSEGLQRLLMLVDQSHWLNAVNRSSSPHQQNHMSPGSSGGSSSSQCKELDKPSDPAEERDEPGLLSPMSEENQEEEFRCQTCCKNYKTLDELYHHQNELGHIEIKQTPTGPGYVCWKKGCNQYFTTINSLQLHYREIHMKNQQNMSVSEKHVYKYRCNQCSLAFKTIDKLESHSQYHIIRDATKCPLCGRSFRSIVSLLKHVEMNHNDLSEEEQNTYKQSIMANPLIQAGLAGNILDPSLNEILKKELTEDEDEPVDDNSDDSYKEHQFMEDYLNSHSAAEEGYKDSNRKYKCHKCKLAFTRQSYLTSHNKTLLHRKGEKMNYPMEKYMDPNRPYKCEICKESFTQRNILLVHYNSVCHLHKKKKMQEQQSNNNIVSSALLGVTSPPSSLNLTKSSVSSEEEDKKPFKCNMCKVAYSQGSTLDIHMRSVLHQTKVSKIQDLILSGQIDLSKPLFEQPLRKCETKKSDILGTPPSQKLSFTSPSSNSSNQQGSSPSNPQSPRTEPEEKENLICQRCNARFQSQDQLTTHQQLYCLFGSPMNLFPPITNSSSTPNRSITPPLKSPGTPDEANKLNLPNKKCSQMYKHLLESFGFDLVMQFNENHQRKRKEREEAEKLEKEKELLNQSEAMEQHHDELVEEEETDLPEVNCKSTCQHCHKEFSSVWVLKAHCEEVHKELVPIDFLEKYAEEFKTEYEKKTAIATTVTTTTTTAISTPNTSTSMSTCTVTSSGIDITPEKEESKESKIAQMQTDEVTPPTASSTPASSTDSIPATMSGLSPGLANANSIQMTLAQQMNEMQAAFNAMAASQLQQQLQQFNPMMMGMASLGMGLPLGLNMPALAAMNLQPPLVPMMMPPPPFDPVSLAQAQAQAAQAQAPPMFPSQSGIDPAAALIAKQQQHLLQQQQQAATAAQQKRARTRITDDQLKILRAHFDINNSPSEEQIHEMAAQSGLPPKVIKHWFRNTLFKERQRNKDSPYNFNNPPSTTLNLEEYEKTGEAKVMPLNSSGSSSTEEQISGSQKENSQRPPLAASSSSPVKKEPGPSKSTSGQQQVSRTPPPPFLDPPQIKSEPRDRELVTPTQENEKFNFLDDHRGRMRRDSVDSFEEKPNFHSPVHHFPPQSPHSMSHNEAQVPQNLPSSSPNGLNLSNILSQVGPESLGGNLPTNLSLTQNMLPPKLTTPNFASPNQVPNSSAIVPIPTSRSVSPARSNSQDFFPHSALGGGGGNSNGSNSSGGSTSGKRANRTRFTDYQIKVLQEFFENNAYPKDDDLEYLSKLLSLSPRVIVVWFQNARQKARKVYENQPPVEPAPGADGNEAGRFQRTPGLNYQCKKCLLVFQRYYELIRHQKTHCFKEEDAKRSAQAQAAAAQIAAVLSSEDSNSSTIENQQHQAQSSAVASSIQSNPPTPSAPVTPTPSTPSQALYPPSPAPSNTPTPDANNKDGTFQCDKCNLVFPRFDLWREHQLVHIMNPNLFPTYPPDSPFGILQQHAQLQHQQQLAAGMSVDLSVNSQQHPLAAMLSNKRKFEDYDDMSDTGGDQPKDKRLRTTILPEQLDYLYQKYQIESNPSRKMLESIAKEVGLKKRVVQVWFQNTRARERKGQFRAHAQVINKRCPFCPALFKVKSALESHLQTKHSDQYARGEINIDSLPDEELSMESVSNFQQGNTGSNPMNPLFSAFNCDVDSVKKYYEESMKRYMNEIQQNHNGEKNEERGECPLDLSKPVDLSRQMKVNMDDSRVVDIGPLTDLSEKSLNDDDSMSETTEMYYYDDSNPVSPASSTQSNHQRQNKRFRTQMSNTQIKVMKSLFNDYKTPTMSECEILGREIGLPKRVIQVWFQNARAKDKKAKMTLQKMGDEPAEKPLEECKLCDFKYSHKYSVQDHIFTKAHIDNVKGSVEQESGNNSDQDFTVPPVPGSSNDQSTPAINHNNNNNTTQHLAQLQFLQMAAASGMIKDKIPTAEELAQLQMLQLAAASGLMMKSEEKKMEDFPTQLQLLQMAAASGLLPKIESNKELKDEMALLQQLYSIPGFMHPSMVNSSAGGGQNIHGNGPNLNEKEKGKSPEISKPGNQEGGTPLLLLNLPQEIFQEVQKIAQAGTPGVTSIRVSDSEIKFPQINNLYREIEIEAGFVCKKCRMAYQTETGLLAHQRNICYPGKLSESRGSVRLLAYNYECRICNPAFVAPSVQEFKRHCESDSHQQKLLKPGFNQQTPSSPSSGLTHEMENVVNQITALAAQAAQENPNQNNVTQDSNANFTLKNSHCQQDPNKINTVNTHVPIHSSGH